MKLRFDLVSHSHIIRSLYEPQFCLHLTMLMFICMLRYKLWSLLILFLIMLLFITGNSFLTHLCVQYERVASCNRTNQRELRCLIFCLIYRLCCPDFLPASTPEFNLNTVGSQDTLTSAVPQIHNQPGKSGFKYFTGISYKKKTNYEAGFSNVTGMFLCICCDYV